LAHKYTPVHYGRMDRPYRLIPALRLTTQAPDGAERSLIIELDSRGESLQLNVRPYVHSKRMIQIRVGDVLTVRGVCETVRAIEAVDDARLTAAEAKARRGQGYIYRPKP
jgi:hypothetical protein